METTLRPGRDSLLSVFRRAVASGRGYRACHRERPDRRPAPAGRLAGRGRAGADRAAPARRRRPARDPRRLRRAGRARRRPGRLPGAADGAPGAPWFPAAGGAAAQGGPVPGADARGLPRRAAARHRARRPGRAQHRPGRRSARAWSAGATPPTATRCSSRCRCCPTCSSGTATRSPSCRSSAVLLAASTRYPHQAFRLGDRAWGLQFHIECDTDDDRRLGRRRPADARRAGLRPGGRGRAPPPRSLPDVEEVWQPFAARFAALALGHAARRRHPEPPAPAATAAAAGPLSDQAQPARPVRLRATTAAAPPTCSARSGLRLWDAEAQGPVDTDAAELLHALSRAADPNLALRQLHRLVEAAGRAAARGQRRTGHRAEPARSRRTRRPRRCSTRSTATTGLRRRLIAVLGASSALGDHLVANPDDWQVLATGRTGLPPSAEGHLELDDSTGRPPTVPALRRAYRLRCCASRRPT